MVAGILTFVVFFILENLQEVWQQYDFFRDLTYFLAMTNKAEEMIGGLITTSNVLYFVIIIAMFLAFTLIRLRSTQESRSWKLSFLRYTLVSLLTLTISYLSARPGYVGYLDLTRDRLNTIHPAMQAVLKELDGSPLTITLYTNILGKSSPMDGLPRSRNKYIWQYWEKFVQFYPHIRYRFEYYYDVNESNQELMASFPGKTVDQAAATLAELYDADIKSFKKPSAIRKLAKPATGRQSRLAHGVGLQRQEGIPAHLPGYQDLPRPDPCGGHHQAPGTAGQSENIFHHRAL